MEVDRLPAQNWAELVAQALQSQSHSGPGKAEEANDGYLLMLLLAQETALQRRSGKLDDARRTADRMLALGRLFVERHPNQMIAYLALSHAYAQLYKNAWPVKDLVTVKRNLKLALDAAFKACLLIRRAR